MRGGSVQDKRVSWYDLDLSTKPYRTMQYHKDEVASVAFHASYPLFASASADGTVHVFHGQVFQVCTAPVYYLGGRCTWACCRARQSG